MTKFAFALAGAAALTLAACSSGNDDAVNEAAVNAATDNLDMMADNAAMDAANAEAQALGEQEQQLNQEPVDNTVNPADADEQNVSGM